MSSALLPGRRLRTVLALLAIVAMTLTMAPAVAAPPRSQSDDALARLGRVAARHPAGTRTAATAAAVIGAEMPFEVVAEGLDQPRGLDFGPDGALYVTEIGSGGDRCVEVEEDFELCFGLTGAVTRVHDGSQERVVTGLPSHADPSGFAATGVHDVAARYRNQLDVVVGLGANLAARNRIMRLNYEFRRFGQALFARPGGVVRGLADPVVFEHRNDPSAGQPSGAFADTNDSNPTSIIAERRRRVVVDAGGNTLLSLPRRTRGRVRLMALFPDRFVPAPDFLGLPPGTEIPMQSVPTSVAKGPDGAYYVGELTGFPFPEGEAKVWRVVPGEEPEVFADGFTLIMDLTFDHDGNLYVLQLLDRSLLEVEDPNAPPPPGRLLRVAPDGSRTELAAGTLFFPGGVDVGPDGGLYVTTNTIIPGGAGQVVRVEP